MPEPTLPPEKPLQGQAPGINEAIGRNLLGVNRETKTSGHVQDVTEGISSFLWALGAALENLEGPPITVLRFSWQQHNGYRLEVVGDSGQNVLENSGSGDLNTQL